MQLLISELLTATRSLSTGALTPGINLFANTMPATPIECVCVSMSGGFSDPLVPLRFPSFQILYRGTSPTSMIALANSIHAGFRRAWNTLPTIKARIEGDAEPSSPQFDRSSNLLYLSANYRATFVSLD